MKAVIIGVVFVVVSWNDKRTGSCDVSGYIDSVSGASSLEYPTSVRLISSIRSVQTMFLKVDTVAAESRSINDLTSGFYIGIAEVPE